MYCTYVCMSRYTSLLFNIIMVKRVLTLSFSGLYNFPSLVKSTKRGQPRGSSSNSSVGAAVKKSDSPLLLSLTLIQAWMTTILILMMPLPITSTLMTLIWHLPKLSLKTRTRTKKKKNFVCQTKKDLVWFFFRYLLSICLWYKCSRYTRCFRKRPRRPLEVASRLPLSLLRKKLPYGGALYTL